MTIWLTLALKSLKCKGKRSGLPHLFYHWGLAFTCLQYKNLPLYCRQLNINSQSKEGVGVFLSPPLTKERVLNISFNLRRYVNKKILIRNGPLAFLWAPHGNSHSPDQGSRIHKLLKFTDFTAIFCSPNIVAARNDTKNYCDETGKFDVQTKAPLSWLFILFFRPHNLEK